MKPKLPDEWGRLNDIPNTLYSRYVEIKLIRDLVGPKCKEFAEGCPVCELWKSYEEVRPIIVSRVFKKGKQIR